MGAARGLDEGLIGTTASQKSFIAQFGLKSAELTKTEQANLLSNITSMVQLGSILGSLIAFFITDKIGRLWAVRELCIIWVAGISIFLGAAANGSIGMVYAGRFIAGVGIGQTTVVAPTYLAEVAPRAIRGLCVGMFSGSVYLGKPSIENTSHVEQILTILNRYYVRILCFLGFIYPHFKPQRCSMGRPQHSPPLLCGHHLHPQFLCRREPKMADQDRKT